MEWEPIKRTGKPDPQDVDERTGIQRIVLHFPLSASPPREWRENFESMHRRRDYPPLTVQGMSIVVLSKADKESFSSWTDNVDRDIQAANKYYVGILAVRQQQRTEAQQAEEERLRRLEEARTWTEGLDPPETS